VQTLLAGSLQLKVLPRGLQQMQLREQTLLQRLMLLMLTLMLMLQGLVGLTRTWKLLLTGK
jgi:hypothetical protein